MEDNNKHKIRHAYLIGALVLLAGCATTGQQGDSPLDTAELVSQARAAKMEGDFDAAIYLYATALENEADDGDLLLELANSYEQTNRLQAASRAYERIIELYPEHVDAYELSGLLLLRMGQHEQARTRLFKAIAFDDDRWQAHDGLGILFDLVGDHGKAIVHYTRALELKPLAASVWNNRGYSQFLAGDYRAAERDFTQAIVFGAGDKTAKNLALSLAHQGHYTEALTALERFDEAESLNEVGTVALRRGQYRVAERLFLKAIDTRPSFYEMADKNLKRARRLMEEGASATAESG